MNRKERKEKADKKRLEITQSLIAYIKSITKTISDEDIKADPHKRWQYILRKGDEWVQQHMKLFPQEAHMYRSAAIKTKNILLEVLNKK